MHTIFGLGSTVSVAVTVYLTFAPFLLVAATVVVAGSFSTGGVTSLTVTVNDETRLRLPWQSTERQLTVVFPTGNGDPLARSQLTGVAPSTTSLAHAA